MSSPSPIAFKSGDLLAEDAEALVNSVNCVGIMGRGVALQFKRAYPRNFKAYQAACRRGEVQPGKMFVFETGSLTNPRYIINFPTKRHWRGRSRMSDIEAGLAALAKEIANRRIKSIALPPLGSGLGGLDWRQVRPLIEAELSSLPEVQIAVFEPERADSHVLPRTRVPRMTEGRAALVGLIQAYLKAHMDPVVTLLEVHKLMYFMQEAGEPLKLRFAKAPYGPYAENLRHVLQAVEGYYTTGYFGADTPTTEISLVPGAVEDAETVLSKNPATGARFTRVVELVEGFETPHGLELLATVHWVVLHENPQSRDGVVRATHEWNERKLRFTSGQIDLVLDRLIEKGWVPSPDRSTSAP
jgi:O-acetyl-ADP-ribose deacetylase (regulator of RNase III)